MQYPIDFTKKCLKKTLGKIILGVEADVSLILQLFFILANEFI